MLATVALLTRNSERTLGSCLQSLRQQDLAWQNSELLVIDHGSTDLTLAILEAFRPSFPNFRMLSDPTNNLGKSRARCIFEARSENVVFVDSDCELPRHWLRRALDLMTERSREAPTLAAICGPTPPPQGQDRFYGLLNLSMRSFWGNFGSPQNRLQGPERWVDHPPTTACLLRRSHVLEVGNFQESFAWVGEDYELGRRLKRSGKKMLFTPELVSNHWHQSSLRAWVRRIFRFGRAQIKVARRHPDYFLSFRVWLPLLFPLVILGAALTAGLVPMLGLIPAIYILSTTVVAAVTCLSQRALRSVPALVALFFATHFAYSFGQWAELIRGGRHA